MPVDDALNGSQSYSGAFKLFSQMQTLKHAEEFVDILHIEACAVVPDEHLDLIFLSVRTANLDFGPSSYARELDRIGKQVDKDQLSAWNGLRNRPEARPIFQAMSRSLRLLPELRDDLLDELLQVHRRLFGLGASDPAKTPRRSSIRLPILFAELRIVCMYRRLCRRAKKMPVFAAAPRSRRDGEAARAGRGRLNRQNDSSSLLVASSSAARLRKFLVEVLISSSR